MRWPASGPDGRIVFTLAADLYVLDPRSGDARKVGVDLPSERSLTRTRYPNAERTLDWFALAPDGDRLAVVTRGEIFSVPVEDGVTLPVTRGSGRASAGLVLVRREGGHVTDAARDEEIRVTDAWAVELA